jgi:hypothetical protein
LQHAAITGNAQRNDPLLHVQSAWRLWKVFYLIDHSMDALMLLPVQSTLSHEVCFAMQEAGGSGTQSNAARVG